MIDNILSALIWIPIISGLLILFYNNKNSYLNIINISINLFVFILSILLLVSFNKNISDFQFIENFNWIPSLNIFIT